MEGGRSKKIRCYEIYIEIKQLGHNVMKMKLKCLGSGSAQHSLAKASVRKFNSATRIPLIGKAHFQKFETHISQKKTAIESSNNVSLRLRSLKSCFCRALFHGGHLVMHSEGWTVAKLENHLKFIK